MRSEGTTRTIFGARRRPSLKRAAIYSEACRLKTTRRLKIQLRSLVNDFALRAVEVNASWAKLGDGTGGIRSALLSIQRAACAIYDRGIARCLQLSAASQGIGRSLLEKGGIEAGRFVVKYLGEIFPPWRWYEKQDAIKNAQKQLNFKPILPDFYNIMLESATGTTRGATACCSSIPSYAATLPRGYRTRAIQTARRSSWQSTAST